MTTTAMPDPPERLLYAIPQVAYLLGGVTERYVRTLIACGHLRSVKLGRRRLVPGDALRDFLKGLKHAAT